MNAPFDPDVPEYLVETSALAAMLLEERDATQFAAIVGSSSCVTAATNVFEAVLAVAKQKNAAPGLSYEAVSKLIETFSIAVVPFTPDMLAHAVLARERYGHGRNGLNLGDCLSYAAAKQLGIKLLYKGDDFARTDVNA